MEQTAHSGTAGAGPGIVADVLAGLATAEGRADPYPLYRRLRALGPASASPDGTLLVTGYTALPIRFCDIPDRVAAGRGLSMAYGQKAW